MSSNPEDGNTRWVDKIVRAVSYRNGPFRKLHFALLAMIIVAGCLGFSFDSLSELVKPKGWVVAVEGKEVGKVLQKETVDKVLLNLKKEECRGYPDAAVKEEITLSKTRVAEEDTLDEKSLQKALGDRVSFITQGAVLKLNEQKEIYLKNEQEAQKALEIVKKKFHPSGENLKVSELKIEENIKIVQQEVPVRDIVDSSQAAEYLLNGTNKKTTHVVKEGESLWTVARNYDMWVEDLLKVNPQLKNETLQIGQELKIVKTEPLVHVVAVYQETVSERIPCQVKYVTDETILSGKVRTRQEGSSGEKKIVYKITERNGMETDRTVIEEKIIKEPVTKIVARGTKIMTASRSGGSGVLAWPLRGSITSYFGYRGSEFHTGVDIDGRSGSPVYAAESGRVIYAGWRGNYGRVLAIDHGGGLVTRYAHLSAFKARVGENVSRGEVVGLVGSTGRSTGSHLHFEVMLHGNFKNPLKYLR